MPGEGRLARKNIKDIKNINGSRVIPLRGVSKRTMSDVAKLGQG